MTLLVLVSFPVFKKMETTSTRAEAKITLSYMATLQSAYHADNGKFAVFVEFYGSQIEGRDQCAQPAGAEDLGFKLRSCGKDPRRKGLRYVYRALGDIDLKSAQHTIPKSFTGEAVSGSDVTGDDFVCGPSGKDRWQVSVKKEFRNPEYCEPKT